MFREDRNATEPLARLRPLPGGGRHSEISLCAKVVTPSIRKSCALLLVVRQIHLLYCENRIHVQFEYLQIPDLIKVSCCFSPRFSFYHENQQAKRCVSEKREHQKKFKRKLNTFKVSFVSVTTGQF